MLNLISPGVSVCLYVCLCVNWCVRERRSKNQLDPLKLHSSPPDSFAQQQQRVTVGAWTSLSLSPSLSQLVSEGEEEQEKTFTHYNIFVISLSFSFSLLDVHFSSLIFHSAHIFSFSSPYSLHSYPLHSYPLVSTHMGHITVARSMHLLVTKSCMHFDSQFTSAYNSHTTLTLKTFPTLSSQFRWVTDADSIHLWLVNQVVQLHFHTHTLKATRLHFA